MKSLRRILGVLVLVYPIAIAAAQSLNTSQIVGIVQDASGAAVSDATVTLTQTDTGFTRTVKTSTNGSYTAPDLPLGPYKVSVTAPSFRTFNLTGVVLQVGSNATVDAKLEVGSVTETVEVQTSGVTVEQVSNGVGQVIDQQQVVELPLNGRDPTALIALAGATTTAPSGDLNSNKNFPTITIAVAGGLPNGVAYVLDGGNHNDVFNNLNLPLPFPDALQEFKSETSSLPAQYGNHASAAINAVTKSGTNAFHGDLFWFVRNYMFNAANFFAPTSSNGTKIRDNLKRNQFGGVIGGPIKRDKLFFFAGYQGTIIRSVSNPTASFTVTQAMLNGDFTACYPTSGTVHLNRTFLRKQNQPEQLQQAGACHHRRGYSRRYGSQQPLRFYSGSSVAELHAARRCGEGGLQPQRESEAVCPIPDCSLRLSRQCGSAQLADREPGWPTQP